MKKFVYLAGPIEQCDSAEINDWRNDADMFLRNLSGNQIIGVNPYRAQEEKYDGDHVTAKQIYDKNYYDTETCDILLAYLPKEINERRPSYGTIFEIAWTNLMKKPIFIITDDPAVERHPLFKSSTQYFHKDVRSACEAINDLIGVYT